MATGGGAAPTGAGVASTQYPSGGIAWSLLAVPVDAAVDILHPTTSARRLFANLSGRNVPPQYGGVGQGRNARANAPIPNVSPGYVAEQEAFRAHDVAIHESGGNFFSLTNPQVVQGHAELARDSASPAISLLFGTLAVVGSKIGGGPVARGGGQGISGGGSANPRLSPPGPGAILTGSGVAETLIGAQGETVIVNYGTDGTTTVQTVGGGGVQTFPTQASVDATLAATGTVPPGVKRTAPLTDAEVAGSVLGFGKLGLPAAGTDGSAIQPPVGPVVPPPSEAPPPELPFVPASGPYSTIDFAPKPTSQLASKSKAKDP